MSGFRTTAGGLIDRGKPLHFTFDGHRYSGFQGDTLASALLANGVQVLGRSFKYHRPRGVWGAWFDDPNAIFDVRLNGATIPNCPASTTALVDGMQARAVNAFPNARFDLKGVLDRFQALMPAGFYYKTFIWPNWHLFEGMIRNMAGLGRLDGELIAGYQSAQHHDRCDLLVVGGGGAGLAAARTAAEAGRNVLLIEDHPELGGGLFRRALPIEGQPPADWIAQQQAAILAAGGRILTGTTAFGVFDHNLVGLAQDHGFAKAPSLWRIRARRILMATGALERPVTFANNDRPGVMGLDGALEYLARYGVLAGRNIAILSNNGFANTAQPLLENAGCTVRLLDPTQGRTKALGKTLRGVEHNGQRITCDALLVSGGRTPLVHLWRHAGGKLDWNETISAFVPARPPNAMAAAGAANGTYDLDDALPEARAAALDHPAPTAKRPMPMPLLQPDTNSNTRQWIDLQHDVTLKDIKLAARENYTSVEHLKRYTTLGMAPDQGKTANMAGLAAMAQLQGRSIPETGTTTFRPPFVPVPLELYHGARRGQLFNPLKRLPLENRHRAAGAALGEYGGWLRPAWYKDITAEIQMARNHVGLLDATPLGKIEVMGPDAEKFLNFVYYNTIATLKPGHIRYGFMLTEGGIVFDDGVVARMEQNRFVVSCSSSHVAGVTAHLESWRQDGNDPDRVFIHDTTANWATLTITGPKARKVLQALDLGVNLAGFPHMTWQAGRLDGTPLRVARVSFTGDTSFEITLPLALAEPFWDTALSQAKTAGGGAIGIEAVSVMRAEKGFIIIGKDTDGETMPHDLGFAIPRLKKRTAFVGDRSLHTETANRPDRRQLVGLHSNTLLPTGAHLVDGKRSIGTVTSSYHSPTLNRPIALALLDNGAARQGETVTVWHMDTQTPATVTAPCFLDPEGNRLHA
jgi:sarcosine oxidase subunit alpha